MRFSKKTGKPSTLPKEVWWVLAGRESQLADLIEWLVAKSRAEALDQERPPLPKAGYFAEQYFRSRDAMERLGKQEDDHGSFGAQGAELLCLLRTLTAWSELLRKDAMQARRTADSQGPGRPQKSPSTLELAAAPRLRGKAGRPRAIDIPDSTLAEVVAMRANGVSRIDALRSFAREHLKTQGKNTAGSRVEDLANQLARRHSRIGRSSKLRKNRAD